jgi:hypothetical protein
MEELTRLKPSKVREVTYVTGAACGVIVNILEHHDLRSKK